MTLLFVYGTLVPGDVAWPRLERWTVGRPRAASVPGALYDTGHGYPAATFAADAPTVVHGVVVELDPARTDEALRALDRYEGPDYERVRVCTTDGTEVFTYTWIAPLDDCSAIADGRWVPA